MAQVYSLRQIDSIPAVRTCRSSVEPERFEHIIPVLVLLIKNLDGNDVTFTDELPLLQMINGRQVPSALRNFKIANTPAFSSPISRRQYEF